MDDNVGVPRTGEGLSVVPSLSEVSEQIAIAEHIPNEHETSTTAVFHAGEEGSSTNVGGHPQCEVQVVKVTNGNVSISFATPAPTAPHIQASQSSLQPIQEVIADSPAHSTRSSSPNLQDSQGITTIQQAEQDENVRWKPTSRRRIAAFGASEVRRPRQIAMGCSTQYRCAHSALQERNG